VEQSVEVRVLSWAPSLSATIKWHAGLIRRELLLSSSNHSHADQIRCAALHSQERSHQTDQRLKAGRIKDEDGILVSYELTERAPVKTPR
jgi:hypothetical protein